VGLCSWLPLEAPVAIRGGCREPDLYPVVRGCMLSGSSYMSYLTVGHLEGGVLDCQDAQKTKSRGGFWEPHSCFYSSCCQLFAKPWFDSNMCYVYASLQD
jgi:hypothetical protein